MLHRVESAIYYTTRMRKTASTGMLFKQPLSNGSNKDIFTSLVNRILAQRGQDHALMYVECCSRTTTLAATLAKVKT